MRARSASSRPDAILITPHDAQTISNDVTSSCSHHALRSRHSTTQKTVTAKRVGNTPLSAHLGPINYCSLEHSCKDSS
eukprot:294170-Pelagomonas_calceolata.AAC.1